MNDNQVSQFVKDPKKALFTLSWPIVVGMLVQVSYNIVDTAWVGRLGANAIAALTFAFPLFFVMIAVSTGLTAGVNSLISRLVGANKIRQAENAAVHACYLSVIAAIVITFLGLLFLRPMFELFGAASDVLLLGINYMRIIFFGTVLMFLGWTLTSVFSAQGDTKTPMKIQVVGLVANIILDPIFIFPLKFGVAGAAIATVISFGLSVALGIYYMFFRDKALVKVNFKAFRYSGSIIAETFKVGFPAMLMQLLIAFYVVIINRFMAHFGTNYVAAFGLGSRLESVASLPFVGISFAMLTLVGMFYGAKKYAALKCFIWYGIKISVAVSSALGLIFFLIPEILFRLFTSDPLLIGLASAYMRIDVFTFPLMAVGFALSRILQGMGDGIPGLVVTLTRVLFVFVPVGYAFVYLLGYDYLSVAVAMVISGVVSNLIGLVWLRQKLRKCKPKAC
jgi:putative MATE family efflux protein